MGESLLALGTGSSFVQESTLMPGLAKKGQIFQTLNLNGIVLA